MPEEHEKHFFDIRMVLKVIVLPLVAGVILASFIPQPKIGIIEVSEALDDYSGQEIIDQLQYAYNDPEMHAVVLIVDCPGGTINDTELIYLEMNHLREKKPVVIMIKGLAASGAYYISMASDYIMSNPSAMVGNVGVIAQLPSNPIIYEEIYSTGPYKFWGSSRDTYVRQIDLMKESFLETVVISRAEKLTIPEEEILRGEIYPASEALQFGLIDAIGSQSEALEKAAELAKIAHYSTINLGEAVQESQGEADGFYSVDENGETTAYPRESGFYYLYVADVKGGLK